jgi:hypothetical protein
MSHGPTARRKIVAFAAALVAALPAGCGSTRMTDTLRTATEQLLVSNAIDQAVSDMDFRALCGKTVFFDPQYLDGTVDRGYLISSLRQQLLACGCLLQEDRTKADYIVEVRSGGVGTDRHALLVGVPQMNVPTFVPGQPSQIPEIPLAKKTDQEGIAKIAVFAYNRQTGKPVWQSGVVEAESTSRDTWVLGMGPLRWGTIRKGAEFAGEPILPGDRRKNEDEAGAAEMSVTEEATWLDPLTPKSDAKRLALLLGAVPLNERPTTAEDATPSFPISAAAPAKNEPPKPAAPAAKPAVLPPLAPNVGGQAETEPSNVVRTGLGALANAPGLVPTAAFAPTANPTETEPSIVVDSSAGFQPDN